jgi:hypothetical protein
VDVDPAQEGVQDPAHQISGGLEGAQGLSHRSQLSLAGSPPPGTGCWHRPWMSWPSIRLSPGSLANAAAGLAAARGLSTRQTLPWAARADMHNIRTVAKSTRSLKVGGGGTEHGLQRVYT